eukprot:XP_001707175.1 Hypothetical protein GL50803_34569 [Giardia lamblia ATCC 50803]
MRRAAGRPCGVAGGEGVSIVICLDMCSFKDHKTVFVGEQNGFNASSAFKHKQATHDTRRKLIL